MMERRAQPLAPFNHRSLFLIRMAFTRSASDSVGVIAPQELPITVYNFSVLGGFPLQSSAHALVVPLHLMCLIRSMSSLYKGRPVHLTFTTPWSISQIRVACSTSRYVM